ncbi:MAG TPA: response regulator transcription factor [Chthoniobacterales bacterium]|nr:response regulator transcription factor [Chthoniobacterales bacterium]
MRILVVEDDLKLARQTVAALTEAGHAPVAVHDGETAVDRALEASFDLIILDVGLPRIDGFEVLRRIRSRHVAARALMLTARGEVKDRVTGLELGADDYLSKPFAMTELIARVNALGRRYAEKPALKLRVADLTLDLVNHETFRGEERLELSARELMMLKVLMREPGRVFTRTELCERIWQHPHEYDTKLVEVFIGRLRKKIGEPSLIRTVRHVGYSIREPLTDSSTQQK